MKIKKIIYLLIILAILISFGNTEQIRKYSISQLYDSSYDNNSELISLRLKLLQDEINLKSAKAKRFPEVSFDVSLSYLTNPMDPITLTAGEFGSYPSASGDVLLPPEDVTVYEGQENTYYQFKLYIKQPIWTWGKISNSILLYDKVIEADKKNILKKQNEIKTNLKIYLHSLYYLLQIRDEINNQYEEAEKLIEIAQQSYNNGFIIYTKLLETKILTKEIGIAKLNIEQKIDNILVELRNITGLDDLMLEDIVLPVIKEYKEYQLEQRDDLKKHLLDNNISIDLLEFFYDISSLQYEIIQANANGKPDIGLLIEIAYKGSRFPLVETNWYGKDEFNITFSIGLNGSVYNSDSNQNDIALAMAEMEDALLEIKKGKEMLIKNLDQYYLDIELLYEKLDYQDLLIENGLAQIDQKKKEYEAGAGDEIEYRKEIINYHTRKIEKYQLYIEFFTNYFIIENLTKSEISI